jgi:hypothetical protein
MVLDTDSTVQSFSLQDAHAVVVDFNKCRVTHASQIVKCLRFDVSTLDPAIFTTLQAALAVLGVHLVRYLHAAGHPPGCQDFINSLSSSTQQEISLIEPSVLQAKLLLRAMSDFEHVPMESQFYLNVCGTDLTSEAVFDVFLNRCLCTALAKYLALDKVTTLVSPSFALASAPFILSTARTSFEMY